MSATFAIPSSPAMSAAVFNMLAVAFLFQIICLDVVHARRPTFSAEIHAKQVEAARRFGINANSKRVAGDSVKNITFTNPRAAGEWQLVTLHVFRPSRAPSLEFYVDGSSIPEVDFDIGPSWSGLLPISNATDESRKVLLCFYVSNPVFS